MIGQRVQHPNVVRTLGVGSTDIDGVVQHDLVREYVEGQVLRDLLTHLREHAPERYRDSMIENVQLHRRIVQAG